MHKRVRAFTLAISLCHIGFANACQPMSAPFNLRCLDTDRTRLDSVYFHVQRPIQKYSEVCAENARGQRPFPTRFACFSSMSALIADICSAKRHVRFTPESGHVQCNSVCPLSANSGHSSHSMTSSARAIRDEADCFQPSNYAAQEIHLVAVGSTFRRLGSISPPH